MGVTPDPLPADVNALILDALDAQIYVVDFDDHAILYANALARKNNAVRQGATCWSLFHPGRRGPCEPCVVPRLLDDQGKPTGLHTRENHDPVSGVWRHVREQAIRWRDGRMVRLVIVTDITERKRGQSIISALHKLSSALWSAHDLAHYCAKVHDIFKRAIGAENFFVGLLDKERDRVDFPYFADAIRKTPFVIEAFSHEGGKSLSAQVIRSGKPLFLRKKEKLERMRQGELAPVGPLSELWLGVPLMAGREAIGVLGVQSYDDPERFSERDLDLLSSAANLIAVTIRRHRDAQALRESEERHKTLSRAAFESIFVSDGGVCLDANATAERMFGYSRNEMIGQPTLSFIAPQSRAYAAEKVAKGCEEPYEALALRKNGAVFPCEIQGRKFQHLGADVRVTALRDVSERKRAEEALRESEERFRSIIKNSPLGLHLYELMPGDRLILIETNPAADRQTSGRNARLIGRTIEEGLAGLAGTPYLDMLKDVARKGLSVNVSGFHYQGEHVNGHFDVWAFQTSKRRMALMFQDASSRFLAEKALVQAKEAAERASRSRSEFLANMSHELRTPLNGVFGMLQLLKNASPSPEHKAFIEAALSTGKGLLAIIDDVLDFSKMDAGKLVIAREEFNLRASLALTADNFRIQAAEKGIALFLQTDPGIPDRLIGDDARLRQILFNLIGNSLKFTESGSISVSVWLLPKRREDEILTLFIVSDTGIGIPDDWTRDVFNPFTQVDGGYNRRYKGAGLGLGIVKRLVTAMGGSISIETEEGKGSSIYFSLPLAPGQKTLPGPPVQSGVPGKASQPLRILLAEDEAINQMALRLALEGCGHTAACASNGREVLGLLSKNVFDLILMDIQMPEMDGLEATRAIRNSPDPAIRDIPIVALTAHAMKGDRETFLEAGMNAYAAKPLDFDQLQELIQDVRNKAWS